MKESDMMADMMRKQMYMKMLVYKSELLYNISKEKGKE